MLMPTKIVKPVDSLFSISAYIIKIISEIKVMDIDSLYKELNKSYYKEVSFEQFLLSLDFLFIINKLELRNETITIKL